MPRFLVSILLACFLVESGLLEAAAPPVQLVDLHGDPLARGAITRLGTVRWRATGGFSDFVVVPGGRYLATQSFLDLPVANGPWGSSLSFWDLDTGRCVRTIHDRVTPLRNGFGSLWAFTADGRQVLSSRGFHPSDHRWNPPKGSFYLWDVSAGKLLFRSPELNGNPRCIAIARDGRMAAIGTMAGHLLLWTPGTSKLHNLYRSDDSEEIRALAFSEDGKSLIAIFHSLRKNRYECIRVTIASGKVEQRFSLGGPARLDLSPDGKTVATYGEPLHQLFLHDTPTGKKRRLPFEEKVHYLEVKFSEDGRTLLTADHWCDRALIWDHVAGKLLRAIPVPGLAQTMQGRMRITNDRKTLFTAQSDTTLRFWDAQTGKPRACKDTTVGNEGDSPSPLVPEIP